MSENGILKKFWIHELTRPAFEDWLDNEPAPVVVIGIGALEQHGPHLPLGTDSLLARCLIHEVASRTNSVCIHPCWSGYSPHHMAFPGTVTFSEDTLLNVLLDTIGSLAKHGIKRFVLNNYHGGNNNIFKLAMQLAIKKYGVMVFAPVGSGSTEVAKVRAERVKRHWDVHSGINETSGALRLFPELVEMWRITDDWIPSLNIDPKLMEFMDPDREDFLLVNQVRLACMEPDIDDFSSDGIVGTNDPREADPEEYAKLFEEKVRARVDFINLWKTVPVPPAFRD